MSKNWTLEKERLQRRWDKLTAGDIEAINGDAPVRTLWTGEDDANHRIDEWQEESADRLQTHDAVECASEASFAASDPRSFPPQTSVREDLSDSDENVTAAPKKRQG